MSSGQSIYQYDDQGYPIAGSADTSWNSLDTKTSFGAAGDFMSAAGDFAAADMTKQVYGTNAAVALQNGMQKYYDAIGNAQTNEVNRQKTATEGGMNEILRQRAANVSQASILARSAANSGDASGITAGSQVNDLAVQREIEVQANAYKTGQVEANTSRESNLQQFYGQEDQRNAEYQSSLLTWEGNQRANADTMSGIFSAAKGIGSLAMLF